MFYIILIFPEFIAESLRINLPPCLRYCKHT